MTTQAQDLIRRSIAAYFDGVSKIALASQAVLLKQMAENQDGNDLEPVAENALGVLAADMLMGAAATLAAAVGALAAEAAEVGLDIDEIDKSVAKHIAALRN
jgi:hypothetical protein